MDSFFDRLRTGAGKAAFEADKMRRVASAQNNLHNLESQREAALYEAGQLLWQLYQEGEIEDERLREQGSRIEAIAAEIQRSEQEIAAIRAEVYQEPVSPHGHVCPNGHGPVAADHLYCEQCGARAVELPPPPQPAASSSCSNCGAPLRAGAHFCAACGYPVAPMAEEAPVIPVVAAACPDCGAPRLPDALFCAECGHSFSPAPPQPPPAAYEPPPASAPYGPGGYQPPPAPPDPPEDRPPMPEPAPAEAACPVCGAAVTDEVVFCLECGYQLRAD